jgi:hypothetical protein
LLTADVMRHPSAVSATRYRMANRDINAPRVSRRFHTESTSAALALGTATLHLSSVGMTMQAFRKAHANAPDSRSRRIPAATKAACTLGHTARVGRCMVPMRVCRAQVRETDTGVKGPHSFG